MCEQRKDFRVPLRLEVRWDGFSGGKPAITSDISLGGCYIESLYPVNIGDILDLDFLPANTEALRLQGQVLYCHQNVGFGVVFVDLQARQQVRDLLTPSGLTGDSCNFPESTSGSLAA